MRRVKPFSFWQSVTGSLEPGESIAAAAGRELAEETGFVDDRLLADTSRSRTFTIDPRWRARYAEGVTENTEYEWRYLVDRQYEPVIDTAEHSEWRWFDIDSAIDAVWSWTNREALQLLRDELRSNPHPV